MSKLNDYYIDNFPAETKEINTKSVLLTDSCPSGSYGLDGSSPCTLCPMGTYASGTGNTRCTFCGGSTYSNTNGTTSCSACAANTAAIEGGWVCCAANQYNTYGSSSCLSCPAGTVSAAGSSSCTCSASTFLLQTYYSYCPTGYTYFPSINKCYGFISTKMTYAAAEATCESSTYAYGWLATITSDAQNSAVYSLVPTTAGNGDAWIGMNYFGSTAYGALAFKFVRGSNAGATYSAWSSGQPENGGGIEACMHMWGPSSRYYVAPANTWNDISCSEVLAAVCETKVIYGNQYCGDPIRNYAVINQNSMGTTNDPILSLTRVELYVGVTKLASTSLTFMMSSSAGSSYAGASCNDMDDNTFCHSSHAGDSTGAVRPDTNPFLVIDSGGQNFDRVVVTNSIVCCKERIDKGTLSIYHGNLQLRALTFASLGTPSAATYTFSNWGGGTFLFNCYHIQIFSNPV